MNTYRIYQKDCYARECEAEIIAVSQENDCDIIACNQSVFYPAGGGQPSDIGSVILGSDKYSVTQASDQSLETEVWHHTDAPAGTFSVGDKITLSIDWSVRFRNMQRHLGEHMLSGAMYSLFGGVNKGFHMGDGYVTIDIDLGGRMLTADELILAEKTVNDAIWANLPVTISWFDTYEDSLIMPVRKQVPHDGRVSVVTVGNIDSPFDCIACCGTHPARSSEVGLVAVYKCEPNKGMNRIFFDCGVFAKNKLSSDSKLLAEVAKRYSCSPSDLMARLDVEASKISTLNAKIASLTSYVKDAEKANILSEIHEITPKVYKYSSDILGADDLLKLGFSVVEELGKAEPEDGIITELLILMSPASNTALLLSTGEAKCGKLVKENANRFGGKGGGRDDNARAIFVSSQDMKDFANAIHEML